MTRGIDRNLVTFMIDIIAPFPPLLSTVRTRDESHDKISASFRGRIIENAVLTLACTAALVGRQLYDSRYVPLPK